MIGAGTGANFPEYLLRQNIPGWGWNRGLTSLFFSEFSPSTAHYSVDLSRDGGWGWDSETNFPIIRIFGAGAGIGG